MASKSFTRKTSTQTISVRLICAEESRDHSHLDVHAFETFVFSLHQFKLLSSSKLCLIKKRGEHLSGRERLFNTDGRENECGMVTTATREEKVIFNRFGVVCLCVCQTIVY